MGCLFELNYLHIPDHKMDAPSFLNDQFIQTLLCAIELEFLKIPYQQIFQACAVTSISPLHLWHSRFGHTSVERFWGEAALTTVYLVNRIPSSVINNKSPYECLHGIPPTYDLLKVSSLDQPPFFINPSVELFPSDSDAGTSNELYNASPHAPIGSTEDDLLVGNALDNFEPSSTSSSTSPIDVAFDIIESPNELVVHP
ncbi:hypothetical protein SLEP1_g49739 [Rubroshorea leprosula]|uniref:GAG-pre-integrase domain-containing protein n=1 Tax=Rubroshorea leprosula TaxID=152421 RepID=A0AAV5LYR2_9ROSI|nr:hypothetical protein SLEP1_g49739 [Rubroshorea leprosula]